MTYKTITVHVNESAHMPDRVRIAAGIALREGAHLSGAAVTAIPAEFSLSGVMGESAAGLDVYLSFMRQRAEAALAEFERLTQQIGVPSMEKSITTDEAAVGISVQARYSDLVVIGQTDPAESLPGIRADFPEYVVMNSGRPVLIIPYAGRFTDTGKRALVAWDATIEATRALTGAIPLLRNAEAVQLVMFNPRASTIAQREHPVADIARYLERHGVKAEVAQESTVTGMDIGNTLLSHAADFSADLIVMGGYGHSRFREILLGGVTDTLLKSMTVPILMAH